jgi:hypothetical protein
MALHYSPPSGFSYDGSKDQFSGMLAGIIASTEKKEAGASSKMGNKGTTELSRLFCSVNYEAHSRSSTSGRRRGRVHKSLI